MTCPIKFDEEKHQYTNDKNEPYLSATQLIHEYCPKFDEKFWLYYKVLQEELGFENNEVGKKEYARYLTKTFKFSFKNKDINDLISIATYLGVEDKMDVSYKKKEWKDTNKASTDKGTKTHNHREKDSLDRAWKMVEGNNVFHYSYNGALENTTFGKDRIEGIPELRLYNHEYKIAGTTDNPYFYPDGSVWIDDFKTNKKLVFENKWENMLHPLSHLPNCNISHYTIQLSLYGWMLEQFGYKVKRLTLTHILYDENDLEIGEKLIEIPYLKGDVENLLNHYANNRRQI